MYNIYFSFFFFNDTATTEIYTLSLHDALPIYSFLSTLSSFISSSSMCKRPAVSTRMTSLADSFASLIAPLTISIGLSVPAPGQSAAPIALATCVSCSRAAGRYTSVDTKIGRCPCWVSHLASLPVVVVLPEPCRPTIIHTEGGFAANSGFACLPSSAASSSRTTLTTCWSGESCSITSLPMAFLRMLVSSSSATPTLTSPSSSASRISARAASRCSSVSLPRPRRFLKARCSFSVRFSNITQTGSLSASLEYQPTRGSAPACEDCQCPSSSTSCGTIRSEEHTSELQSRLHL